MAWLPQQKVLMPGDLYYRSFPNLSTPMLESRPVRQWAESLDRMADMKPAFLVPSHSEAVIGEKVVVDTLRNYSAAIRHVFNKTIKAINDGKPVHKAIEKIKLPERLAKLPYLREYYCRITWPITPVT